MLMTKALVRLVLHALQEKVAPQHVLLQVILHASLARAAAVTVSPMIKAVVKHVPHVVKVREQQPVALQLLIQYVKHVQAVIHTAM
jgi:hypothetical protein